MGVDGRGNSYKLAYFKHFQYFMHFSLVFIIHSCFFLFLNIFINFLTNIQFTYANKNKV